MSDRIGCRMKLQDLHVLMTVAQAGSMGKAAERLNTTQPNVSRSIAQLEEALGVRLLDRTRRGVELTKCGRTLVDCGEAVFDDLRQGVKSLRSLADPTVGEVRIGCNPFLASSYVSTLVELISRRYPAVVAHLVIEQAETLHELLAARKLDFLITRRWGPIADDRMNFEFLFDDSFVIVAGAQNPWVRRRRIGLADLMDEPWVLPPSESGFGAVAKEAFLSCGLSYPRASVIATPPDVRIHLLTIGRYLTIFPASVLSFSHPLSQLRVLPVQLPMARIPNGIVTLKNRIINPVAQLLIDHARELAKSLPKKTSAAALKRASWPTLRRGQDRQGGFVRKEARQG